ncbi:MAG TPA: RNA methyltransferase [Acidobacteriota bacterium]|nr:RNA methyltransferase [Acidobacteriota bacterium]
MHSNRIRIDSPSNPRLRRWTRILEDGRRKDASWVGIEGVKQILELSKLMPIRELLVDADVTEIPPLLASRSERVFELEGSLYRRISGVESPQGVLAFFDRPRWSWDDMTPRVLYLDRLQDPGNLGTLIRTAAAAGTFSLAASPGTVSFFNRKVVRSSAGLLFRAPFLEDVEPEQLSSRKYRFWLLEPSAERSLFETALKPPYAVVVGSEGAGLDRGRYAEAGARGLRIPMAAGVESLNAAVAASLIMYEEVRRSLDAS